MPESVQSLTELYDSASQCVVAFINKMQQAPVGQPPIFPAIIGTGFLANSEGLALTNRHVVDALEKLPKHPTTATPVWVPFFFSAIKIGKDANSSAFKFWLLPQLAHSLQVKIGKARRLLT
jgi:S1-C subfamily serine protease